MLAKSLIAEYLCKNSLQKLLDMEEKVLPKSILSMKKQQSLLGEFNERLKDMTAAYARLVRMPFLSIRKRLLMNVLSLMWSG